MQPQLSQYFTWKEATVTNTGLPNIPDTPERELAIIYTAAKMDAVRELLGAPVYVNSWYRSAAVNKAVGGVPTSQHAKGEAVDFTCPKHGSPYKICKLIQDNWDFLRFDQLILEPTWVHISFSQTRARGQVLTLVAPGCYRQGLLQ